MSTVSFKSFIDALVHLLIDPKDSTGSAIIIQIIPDSGDMTINEVDKSEILKNSTRQTGVLRK